MLDTTATDPPDWWTDQKGTAKSKSMPSKSPCHSSECSKSQSLVRSFTVPLFSASEQKRFNHEMALYSYCTGTSFQRAENPFLLRAMQLASPGAKLLTRKQLADDGPGSVLGKCYQNVKGKVNKALSNLFASQVMHGQTVVNYMTVSPTKSLSLKAVHTEEQSHDAYWIATDVSRVIDRQCGW